MIQPGALSFLTSPLMWDSPEGSHVLWTVLCGLKWWVGCHAPWPVCLMETPPHLLAIISRTGILISNDCISSYNQLQVIYVIGLPHLCPWPGKFSVLGWRPAIPSAQVDVNQTGQVAAENFWKKRRKKLLRWYQKKKRMLRYLANTNLFGWLVNRFAIKLY